MKLPDTGPGSISQPLLSGTREDEPLLELQPVPVLELSLFFGAVLLLAIGYLSFTARYTEAENAPGNRPPARP